MGHGRLLSDRNEVRTSKSWFLLAIQGPGSRRKSWKRSSIRSLQPNLTAQAWGFAFAVPSSNRIEDAYGLKRLPAMERFFSSTYRRFSQATAECGAAVPAAPY